MGIVQEQYYIAESDEIPAVAENGMKSNDNEVANLNTEAMISLDSGSTGIVNFLFFFVDDFEMDLFNLNKDTN